MTQLTTVHFNFVSPDGNPLVNAAVEIQLAKTTYDETLTGVLMPRPLEFRTDNAGAVSADLWPNDAFYYVTVEDTDSDAILSYKFIVPKISTPVRLQDIVVDRAMSNITYDEAALLLIHDVKANVLAARDAAAVSEANARASELAAAASAVTAVAGIGSITTNAASAQDGATRAETARGQASTSATNAATSASQALASKNAAGTSETNAKTSETNAAGSATAANTSAGQALSSKNAAGTSETNAKTSETNAKTSENAAKASAAALGLKYSGGIPTLLVHLMTGGSGARNVVQGHVVDLGTNSVYALQLKDSADAFFVKKCKFGNPRIPGNVVDILPNTNLIVHQGLFLESVGPDRFLWAGGDASLQPALIRVTEADGTTVSYNFDPSLSPVANMGSGTWTGNVTMCLDVSGTKLFIRLGRGSKDYILRYDFAAFKVDSTTAIAEACFPVATEQYSGTSFQGIAADEDTIYVMSGNTVQNLSKLLYGYDYAGNIKQKRMISPHYFESFRFGTKSEVEGIQIVQLPNNQRILTMMMEMGTPAHNIHRLYYIPQYANDAAFASSAPGIFMNDYGVTSVGGMPVADDSCLFSVVNEKTEITRFGVRALQSIGPTGGGMQMVIGTDNTANWVQRENAPATFWTNNTSRMVLAADRARLDIGLGETGPQPGNVSPGYRLGLNIGALSTLDATTTEQEILRMGWSEGSQDLGIGEGIYACFGATLNGGTFQPLMNIGISKVSSSDSVTGSYGFIASSPGTGLAPIKYINWTNTGTIFPLADAQQTTTLPSQDLGSITAHWRDTYTKNVKMGTGTTLSTSGTGSPEGVITAPVGSRYYREDASGGFPRLYWKATGTGATGWISGQDVVTVKQTAVPSATLTGTLTETVLATITIPGGLMGPNGVLTVVPMVSMSNSANNKTLKVKFAGVVYSTPVFSTSVSCVHVGAVIRNRGATNSQIGPPLSATTLNGTGASSVAFTTSAIDTTVDQIVLITGQLANIADSMTLEGYQVQINPG